MRPAPDLPAAPNSALEQDLGFTLGVIFRAYVKAANAVVRDIPGGPRGYQVIVAAVQHQADGQGALAQRLGVDRTVMTYLIDDLEVAGLVERRADPLDRRSRHIVATPQGQQLWSATEKRLQDVEDRLLGPLTLPERTTFRALLQRLAARANALDPVENQCDVVEDVQTALGLETPAADTRRTKPKSIRHQARQPDSS